MRQEDSLVLPSQCLLGGGEVQPVQGSAFCEDIRQTNLFDCEESNIYSVILCRREILGRYTSIYLA